MANPVVQLGVRKTTLAVGAAIDSTGAKATYTAPSGKGATVTGYSAFHSDVAAVMRARITRGANTAVVQGGTAGQSLAAAAGVNLEAGDAFNLFVSTAGAAAATGDFTISVLEEA